MVRARKIYSKKINKHIEALKILAKANRSIQKTLLSNASKELISTLIYCVKLILKGDVQFTRNQLKALRPYEQMLKRFIAARTSTIERKKILQKGGLLGLLLKPLVKSIVPGLINGIVSGI